MHWQNWRINALIIVFLFIFKSTSFGAQPHIEKHILDNGMTLLVTPMASSEVVSLYAYVKAGSATEDSLLGTGISHYVEHMLFKGTKKRGVGVIAQDVKSLGGSINASTTFDYTMYTLDVPKGMFKEGLDILSDMLMNSVFDVAQIEKEREVIHGEMRLYIDRPDRRLSENVFRNAYIQHPYRHPIIGYRELFDRITQDELHGYYRSKYIPNNIIFSVAGSIDPVEVKALIQETFKDFKRQPYLQRNVFPEPPQIAQRYLEEFYKTDLYRFSISYQGVALNDPDLYALDVLAMALGQGESSRFYLDIYDRLKLVQQISASNYTPQDRGIFEIEGIMTNDNLSKVQSNINAIIQQVQLYGLSADELEKTKRQVRSQFIFGNQTSSNVAYRAALDEAINGNPAFSAHYVDAIKNVSNEDIKRVANHYFKDSTLSVTVLKPLSAQQKIVSDQDKDVKNSINKIVLDNGLTILFKEDHAVNVVAINVVANGGTRLESLANNGISQLFSRVWTKGTTSKSSVWIAREMERRGLDISAFAGRNSVGLKVNVLSEDLPFAFDLLLDIVQNPALSKKIIEDEKENLITAIVARDDDISQMTSRRLMETLYLTHPYRLDLLGTKESINRITDKGIRDYYQKTIVAKNMVVSIIGDFDRTILERLIQQKWSRLTTGVALTNHFDEQPPDKTRFKEEPTSKEQAMIMYAFQAPSMNAKDRWSMDIIDAILGSGLSGRLFVKVRDELGQAYTVGSDYTPGIDNGTFVLFALTTNDKVDSVKAIVEQQLNIIQHEMVTNAELAQAKAFLKGNFKMSLTTPSVVGSVVALNELYGLGYGFHESFDFQVDQVTKEDVLKATQYFDINKSAIVVSKGIISKNE